MITVRQRAGSTGADGTRIEVDVRVPYTALGRKLYHTQAVEYRLPEAHVHTGPHLLSCLYGEAVIGRREAPGGPIQWTVLTTGESLRIDGGVAHQLKVRPGTVVASYFSPLSWLGHNEKLDKLGKDWFAE